LTYTIEPRVVTDFLKERLELPVFQRAPSWKDRQNFNLLLSVFKGFPIGVVVVSSEDGGSRKVLLDGRQRREALAKMTDPDAIAHWAFRSLRLRGHRLSKNASDEDWESAFWARVEEFLGNPDSAAMALSDALDAAMAITSTAEDSLYDAEADATAEEYGVPEEDRADESDEGGSLDEDVRVVATPPVGLTLQHLEPMEELLHILLLSRRGSYARLFDFREFLGPHPRLKYLSTDGQGQEVISTAALSEWIREAARSWGDDVELSPGALIESINDQYVVVEPDGLRDRLTLDWSKYVSRIRALVRLEDYLRNTRLGYIEVAAPTAADEMKIFELINTGGTTLTSAEILSAKRDWNIEVKEPSEAIRNARRDLYRDALRIPPRDDVVRRWDVSATLADRLSVPWVLGSFNVRKKAQFEAQTILGFQLYAGRYLGRLMKDDLGELGSRDDVPWGTEAFETEIDQALQSASCIPLAYWQQWSSWGISLRSVMSAAVALEFLLLLVTDWRRKGQPTAGASAQSLRKNAVTLIDRLIFEYLTRRWAGSSDSKIASDLRTFVDGPPVVPPVPPTEWAGVIDQALAGEDRFAPPQPRTGKSPLRKEMRLLLLYFAMLRGIEAPAAAEHGYAVDHIIPEAKFAASSVGAEYRNRITNLAIVSEEFNRRKSDYAMDALPATHATWLAGKIGYYEQINENELTRYTSAADAAALHSHRAQVIRDTFQDHRSHFLEYLTPQ
jgi:hypothetical protein